MISRGSSIPELLLFLLSSSVFSLDAAHDLWSYHSEPSKSNDMSLRLDNRCGPVMFQ